ncbi:ankyrin repeat domain-containing protein [Aquimarina sp. AD10]|uniref:ankyrin repeat domain-containing protein n=1 Tax=Aquimarina sp. AD10 TaxID=1714849 RepID=UPI000E4DE886|nr:ankyrin repeat domain-containing protein [Aquimarina sp. AD10]AXT62672.1 ankyrin repeat domain-containing protein [Aquimarina sp. AD10]RKM98333.1 ankyrin repeat domain-containing protein [Aquimarina sp. AD10]
MKNRFCIYLLLTTGLMFAQETNIFLNRDYWKTNPTIAAIEEKIKEGNDITQHNKHFFDAVSYALIEKVENKTIKHLLTKKGNGVNKLTHDGRTYIFWAAYRNNLEMMQFLVDNGAKTNIIDSHGYSLLNFAAVTGQLNTKLYDFCIAHGAKLKEEKNPDGANALLLVAPFIKEVKLVDYFTSKGIDLRSTDDFENNIFNYAAKKGNITFMNALIKKGISFKHLNKKGENAMIFASQGTRGHVNNLDTFKYLESLGINPNITTKNGVTPLHLLASKTKDVKVLEYFLNRGIDINQQNKNGKSPLTNAIHKNSIEITMFFINNGADIFIKDKKGNNLTHYLIASYNSRKKDVFNQKLELLILKGLDVTESQGKGNTLFHLALEKNDIDLLKKIKALNIDVNAKNKQGLTALHKAAMTAKDDRILRFLLSIGADKTIKTDFEESVLDLATENELLKKNNIALNFLK